MRAPDIPDPTQDSADPSAAPDEFDPMAGGFPVPPMPSTVRETTDA